ncbi:hypothetical protein TWF694_010877 [Orbilia ellipsospora]|uniref:Lethal giant larvae (Lgl)-like C-terminal domain-containing protein n=1 Tax=Orbilia ellipsospora TaxID=2528407 RepID=A0AAV9X7C7_9PEZI
MSFLRHKTGGGGADANLTGPLSAEEIMFDDIKRYGFRGQILSLAYDPVQSLIAVGTGPTANSPSNVYVFGAGRVTATYELPSKGAAKHLKMYDNRLVVVDTKYELHHFDLITHARINSWSPPGAVSAVLSDPASDFIFIGLQNGEVVAFDLDRDLVAPFRIPNIWRQNNPKVISAPVVSLALHPRDLGSLLIGYSEGAVVYSIKQAKAVTTISLEIPAGAPGADVDPLIIKTARHPKLTNAIFSPNGNFILTTHEDGCLAFFSTSDGRLLTARTVQDGDVHLPVPPSAVDDLTTKQPIYKVAWCCTKNIDETTLLIAGGNNSTMPAKGISLIEFGASPNFKTSQWKQIVEHLSTPKRQRFLPVLKTTDVVDFCLIPRTSPYFAGAHDVAAAILLFSDGDITTMRLPDGSPISPAGMMHVNLNLIQPRPLHLDMFKVNRAKWLIMHVTRDKPDPFFKGGVEVKKMSHRNLDRNIAYTIHHDAIVRMWDVGHNDEIDQKDAIEVDVSAIVTKPNIKITNVSASTATAEMAVGLESGEVVMYRWGRNKNYHSLTGPTSPPGTPGYGASAAAAKAASEPLRDISDKADPSISEGLLPYFIYESGAGAVKALAVSDVGFLAVGYEDGSVSVIDLRGPTVITNIPLNTITKDSSSHGKKASKESKRKSIFKKGGGSPGDEGPEEHDFAQTMAFSVMTLSGDEYSSICLHIGTSLKNVVTLKILPDGVHYAVSPAGSYQLEDNAIELIPINTETGASAGATGPAVAGLREGRFVKGMLVCVMKSGARIITPPDQKLSSKSWDETCISASVVESDDKGVALACVMNNAKIKLFSLPALKDLGNSSTSGDLPVQIDRTRLSECRISREGYITGWTGLTEIGLFYMWGVNKPLKEQPKDVVYNPEILLPPRPTITGMQWISGTQHISNDDFDRLVGGPDRPMSKKQLEEARRAAAAQDGAPAAGPSGSSGGGGLFGNMSAAFNERTKNLANFSDNMAQLENTSNEFAKATTKFIENQKKQAALGFVKKLF